MEIRNEQRAHRADSAQLLQRFLRIEQDFKRIQKGHQESLEREREFERRISALEELIKQQAPAAAPSSFGLDDLALRYVLEYTADQQRQREELGKLALAPPPGRGLARVAEDLGVDPGRLSMQGKGKVMVMDMGTAKAAQAWLNRFRAGGGSGYSAWRLCTLLQQMRGKKALHRLCLEVQKLGVQGLHAFVSKDRCNLLLSWAPVKVFEQGAPHTVYPA